jgi:hypothetical protein
MIDQVDAKVYDRIVQIIDVNGLASLESILKDDYLKDIMDLRIRVYKLLRNAYFYEAMTGMLALGELKFEFGEEKPQVNDGITYTKGLNPNNVKWTTVSIDMIKNPITRKKGPYEQATSNGSEGDLTNLVAYVLKTRDGYSAIEYHGYKYWVSNDRITLNRRKIMIAEPTVIKPIEDGAIRALAIIKSLNESR